MSYKLYVADEQGGLRLQASYPGQTDAIPAFNALHHSVRAVVVEERAGAAARVIFCRGLSLRWVREWLTSQGSGSIQSRSGTRGPRGSAGVGRDGFFTAKRR